MGLALGVAVGSCAWAACATNDALCYPDSNPADKSDDCPYGPPGGPKVQESACPDIEQSGDGCTVSWDDVYGLFDGPQGGCTASACHGDMSKAAFGIYLPTGDSMTAYATLTSYKGAPGYPYIDVDSPKHSWILCNLKGVQGGGYPMPKPSGFTDPMALETIATWARCGMPGPGVTPDAGGAGGGGGAGP